MYFEMSQDNFQKYGLSKWPQVPDGVDGFMSGELLDIPVPEPLVFLVDYTAKHPPVDFVTSFMLTMSDRMVEALRKASVGYRKSKWSLVFQNGRRSWENYYA